MPDTNSHLGACLCGSITLRIDKFTRDVSVCHCQQCRKQTGHVLAAASTLDEHLHIDGEEHLTWYAASDSAKRGFCNTCGSVLLWKSNDSETTSIMAGCIESPTGLTIKHHIFVADKGDYYTIDDGLPRHPQSSS
jgi:hypothetical protein